MSPMQCMLLIFQVGYLDRLRSRLVDVGFLGKWWLTGRTSKTNHKIRNYFLIAFKTNIYVN